MMKQRLFAIATIVALLLGAVTAFSAMASGYTTTYTTAITYQNMSTSPAVVMFSFYPEGSSTKVDVSRTLSPTASSSLNIGGLSEISSPFKGSVVMSSDQLVVATMVQLPQNGIVKNRPLSNGFSTGAPTALIATAVRHNFSQETIVSIQNADSVSATVTGLFYASGSVAPVVTTTIDLPPGAGKYYDLGAATLDPALTGLGSAFNGSIVFQAVKLGTTTGANIVASAMEMNTNNNGTKAFEGVASGSNTLYMPSAMCKMYATQQTTYYAIQNTSLTQPANVTVAYSNGYTQTATITPGNKASFNTCLATLNGAALAANTFNGSATLTSEGGALIGIGKVNDVASNISSAFEGASGGVAKLALPYVRWALDADYTAGNSRGQRAFIAIQNLGSDIPAGQLSVTYYDYAGNLMGTHTFATAVVSGQKVNSTPLLAGLSQFGYYGSIFGGSAIVQGPTGSQLAVVTRIASGIGGGAIVGEDYDGIPVP
jgi:hypothetical protein